MHANGKLTAPERNGWAESAGIKVRALLLARHLKEGDLADPKMVGRNGFSHGSFLKFANRLLHGKVRVPSSDLKLRLLAGMLRVPVRLLSDDSAWPDERSRFGLNDLEIRTVRGLQFLYQWYLDHTGPEAAHKYLSLDFDMLRRQTQILRSLARTFGDDALIRVFVISDYEEGRFDREFATIERLAERTPSLRRKILEYVADMPVEERVAGRSYPPLRLGDLEIEIGFTEDLPEGRAETRYVASGPAARRKLRIRTPMTDERLAFILAREASIHLAGRQGLIPSSFYREHHWPGEIHQYAHRKAEVMVNRLAAAVLAPRAMVRRREKEILLGFSHETIEAACRDFGVAPETLLLRIVQLNPREAHFIRIDAPTTHGRFILRKLFRGNGLPLHYRYRATGTLPKSWGAVKSLRRFLMTDPSRASQGSRHVQVTRMSRCGDAMYVCMSLAYPRYGGGAKVLCIGFRKPEFQKMYGALPRLTESRVAVDDTCFDVEWDDLMRLETESRTRTPQALNV